MHERDGPLPVRLLSMTFVTGVVDAFSYLKRGRVFVANMTGNVVFLGFAADARLHQPDRPRVARERVADRDRTLAHRGPPIGVA